MAIVRLIIFTLIIILPISATAQSNQKITLGSVLTAGENATWRSSSGYFAFGFQQVPAGGYILAVVFAKTPKKTIAWAANRDNVVGVGSKVQLSENGLVLSSLKSNDQQIWAGPGVAYGTMLDNGNFVLVGNNSTYLWQSFDEPTDTLLPGQVLNQNGNLFSSHNETDYSRGRFKLIMQTDNNLVLYPLNYPFQDTYTAYWASNTVTSTGIYRAIFNESGYLYVADQNGKVINLVFSETINASMFYVRLTLDFDGVLRRYVYDKTDNSWLVIDYIPTNICDVVVGNRGGGVCGFNSVCNLVNEKPDCSCPKGYSFLDTAHKVAGCKPDFTRQNCDQDSIEIFEPFELNNTEWRDSEYEYYGSVSEDECSESCMKDCFCDAAYFRNEQCWKYSIPLRHGRFNSGSGGKTWLKSPRNK